MEEIMIPNITAIIGSTENTVDTFCAWAEALQVPVKDRPEERFLSVAKSILKKLKSSADVDGLLHVLGSVILSLSSECYGNVAIKGRKLPRKTQSQKQAMSRKVHTFDEMARKKLSDGVDSLHEKIKEHEDLVAKFKTVQQRCQVLKEKLLRQGYVRPRLVRAFKKFYGRHHALVKRYNRTVCQIIQDILATMSLGDIDMGVFKQMEKSKHSDTATKFLSGSEKLFVRVAGFEYSVRVTLRKISDELVNNMKDSIVGRLTHGVQCIEDAVLKFPRSETTDKCMKMISNIDKVGVAYSLVTANSTFYFCPQVLEHLQTFGWRECIPKARLDRIEVDTTDSGLDLEASLEIKSKMKIRRPGMLKLRQGMKIKQSIFVNDLDLAFGSRRTCKLLPVSWGYFYKSHTS